MRRRQRKDLRARRRQHGRTRKADRPRFVLDRETYPDVRKAHIVPRLIQRSFAVGDKVAVHVDGSDRCVLMPTTKAGTRERYYRRVGPTGERIDDVEACLSVVEDKAHMPLKEIIAGEPMTPERKGILAQLLGVQMLRGPAFFEQREELLVPMLRELRTEDFTARGLALVDGDVELARTKAIDAYLGPTQRFLTMLTMAVKMATVLGHMRWHVLRFTSPVLAYSDHPVVLWPMDRATSTPFARQGLAPLSALEVRVPLAPDVAILMNWVDRSDKAAVHLQSQAAAELNAFTVGQADRQWMHRPGSEPIVSEGIFAPISRLVDPSYARPTLLRSARRLTAQHFLERVREVRHVNSVEVLVDLPPRRPRR